MWKGSRRDFSAIWRVPAGAECDGLRIALSGRFMVILVRSGSIRLSHGDTRLKLRAGQAAAVSVAELEVEVPYSADGDSVFIVHLFHRMPGVKKLGKGSLLAGLVERQGRHPGGIFGYHDSGQLRFEAPPVWVPGDPVALLQRLFVGGLESTVRFVASGQGRTASVKPKLRPRRLALANLPKPVAGLVW